jgi:hypothetical protein
MGSVLDASIQKFSGQELQPLFRPQLALSTGFNLPPSVTISKGQLMAPVSGGNMNETQTLTLSASLSSGNFSINVTRDGVTQIAGNIGYNPTAAQVQSAIVALGIIGTGNCTVTGSTGGPFTFTFGGGLANTPLPLMGGNLGTLAGGTPALTFARTQAGQTAGTLAPYAGAVIAPPSTAPTLTPTGSGGTIGAGTYFVNYTLVTALGETTPSPAAPTTLTSAQSIVVTSITGLASSVTAVNFYINGCLSKTVTPTSGATGSVTISAASTTLAGSPPTLNGANPKPMAIARYDIATDSSGNITFGAQSGGGFWGDTELSSAFYVTGDYSCADVIGLDTNAITAGGLKLITGTVTSGILRL